MNHDKVPYLIFSREHLRWWAPGRRGYVIDIKEAGRYSKQEAEKIVLESCQFHRLIECPPEFCIPDPYYLINVLEQLDD